MIYVCRGKKKLSMGILVSGKLVVQICFALVISLPGKMFPEKVLPWKKARNIFAFGLNDSGV